jgi:hypothetical protein
MHRVRLDNCMDETPKNSVGEIISSYETGTDVQMDKKTTWASEIAGPCLHGRISST